MFATGTTDLAGYQSYLESHPDEYPRLVGSFLIKVTGFFRDPELFAALRERVLPDLIAQARGRGNVLRIWSAGCATGEEAYSLAILVAEALGEELDQFTIQIFATDVDEDAIEFARHGIYPAAALSGVAKQRRERYFQRLDGNYQITKALRGLIIFGIHDLGQRAAFPHIDLVVCRNVLMYFTKELQARSLQLFAFSLRNGGYLALGNAETTNLLPAYFDQVSSSLKLYRRHGDRVVGPMPTSESLQTLVTSAARPRPRPPSYVRDRAEVASKRLAQQDTVLQAARNSRERLGLLLLGLPIGVVVIDRHYDIQIINEVAMRLLGIFTEPLGEDLIHLAQTIPSNALRMVIDAAFRRAPEPTEQPTKQPTKQSEVTTQPSAPNGGNEFGVQLEGVVTVETLLGERRNLQFTCFPYAPRPIVHTADLWETQAGQSAVHPPGDAQATPHHADEAPLVLILIRDVTAIVRTRTQLSQAAAEEQAQSRAEQARARSELETSLEHLHSENTRLKTEIERQGGINRALLEGNQKLASANLALRVNNEELQVSEEEAEASTEEVKTLNEELQATNEELVTVNEELEATVEELHAANEELEARTRELQEMTAAQQARYRGETASEQSTE